jgi:hypothetical protein
MDTNIWTLVIIAFSGFLLFVFSYGMLAFGKLIANTPDMYDRYGDRKGYTDAPVRHARLFIQAFWTVFVIGALIMVKFNTIYGSIFGGVIVLYVLMVAGTLFFCSMGTYNTMKENAKDYPGTMERYIPGVGAIQRKAKP